MNSNCVTRGLPLGRAVLLFFFLIFSFQISAQTSPDSVPAQPKATPTPSLEKEFFVNILKDQRGLWTYPFSMHRGDAKWGIPLGLATAALVATDRGTSGELFEDGGDPSRSRLSKGISKFGFLGSGGAAAVFYLVGRSKNNARAKETGLLSAEALINSQIMVHALKAVSQRPRPPVDNASGEFFDGGDSFPSGHAITAWSVATVIAEEYGPRRPLVRFGVYGLATAVSLSRYTGGKHFLSDVLVGSALGYGIGRYVYRQHHDVSLDSEQKGNPSAFLQRRWVPQIMPLFQPHPQLYGAKLTWDL